MPKEKDPDTTEKIKLAHEIKHYFMYTHNSNWVNEKELKYHNRAHNQAFNDLVKRGFIERKKTYYGYQYRWKGPV